MTDNNKFFRFVWRANAILLLVVVVAVVAFVAVKTWKPDFDPLHRRSPSMDFMGVSAKLDARENAYISPVDQGVLSDENAPPEKLYGLWRQRTTNKPYIFLSPPYEANILAVDEKTKSSRWMFAAGDHVILSQTLLRKYEPPVDRKTVDGPYVLRLVGLVLIAVEADTDKDGELTVRDRQTLYFYALDGKPPIKVLSADRILLQSTQTEAKQLRLFYQDGGRTFAAIYSLPACEEVAKIAVAGMPKLNSPNGQAAGSLETVTITGPSE